MYRHTHRAKRSGFRGCEAHVDFRTCTLRTGVRDFQHRGRWLRSRPCGAWQRSSASSSRSLPCHERGGKHAGGRNLDLRAHFAEVLSIRFPQCKSRMILNKDGLRADPVLVLCCILHEGHIVPHQWHSISCRTCGHNKRRTLGTSLKAISSTQLLRRGPRLLGWLGRLPRVAQEAGGIGPALVLQGAWTQAEQTSYELAWWRKSTEKTGASESIFGITVGI